MKTSLLSFLLAVGLGAASPAVAGAQVPRFGLFEAEFEHQGEYGNPYRELSARARLTDAAGRERLLPLFWDGGRTWRMRLSPDQLGRWSFRIESPDPGLNGRQGSFEVVESQLRGGLIPMPEAPYHFAYQDGTPMWFMGETNWALFYNSPAEGPGVEEHHNRETVAAYLDKRVEQGFNVIHAQVVYGQLNPEWPGWTNAGGVPFLHEYPDEETHRFRDDRLNPRFFQQFDRDLLDLNRRGLTVGLILAWSRIPHTSQHDWRDFADEAARLRFAEYVAARYGAFDVYFIVAGEWEKTLEVADAKEILHDADDWRAIGRHLLRVDPHRRLIGIHNYEDRRSFFGTEDWSGFGEYMQSYHQLHRRILLARQDFPDKPTVNSEYAYYLRDQRHEGRVNKPNSATLEDIRDASWDIVMGGGYFITGFGDTYYGGVRHPTSFDADPRMAEWEQQVGHTRRFFESIPWWTLSPNAVAIAARDARRGEIVRTADTRAAPPHNTRRPPLTTYWLLSDPGRAYVGYFRGIEGSVAISVRGGAERLQSRLYDPRSGEWRPAPVRREAHEVVIDAPDERDWVWLLQRH